MIALVFKAIQPLAHWNTMLANNPKIHVLLFCFVFYQKLYKRVITLIFSSLAIKMFLV